MYSNKTALSAIAIKGEMCYNNVYGQSIRSASPFKKGKWCKMDIVKGDILVMKKSHPCGSNRMIVLRSGMDFKLRCEGCGREFMIVRSKAEKNVKTIIREAES